MSLREHFKAAKVASVLAGIFLLVSQSAYGEDGKETLDNRDWCRDLTISYHDMNQSLTNTNPENYEYFKKEECIDSEDNMRILPDKECEEYRKDQAIAYRELVDEIMISIKADKCTLE